MRTYQRILGYESTLSVLAHRKFLNAKILCLESSRSKENYKECLSMVDNALIQVFNAAYTGEPEDERIGDLIAYLDEIERLS